MSFVLAVLLSLYPLYQCYLGSGGRGFFAL